MEILGICSNLITVYKHITFVTFCLNIYWDNHFKVDINVVFIRLIIHFCLTQPTFDKDLAINTKTGSFYLSTPYLDARFDWYI